MDVSETDLPGVGKKHEFELKAGQRAVVLTHNSGKRELLQKGDEDADAERLFELTDQEARVLGTILEGAYFQPVESEDDETTFADGMVINWLTISDSSPVLGDEVAAVVPAEVTVLAIYRDGDLMTGSPPQTTFEPGDTVIVAGPGDAVDAFDDRTGPEA